MSKIKLYASCMLGVTAALCLSGCQTISGAKAKSVEPKPGQGAVVMLDPSSDDAMLPAIGEQMSQGRVTIYSLDGGVPNTGVMGAMTSPRMMPPGAGLTPMPFGTAPSSNDNVTVYSLDTGAPMSARDIPVDIRPQIAPMSATKLDSPFSVDGKVVAKEPVKKKTKKKSVASKTSAPKRPKTGMTF